MFIIIPLYIIIYSGVILLMAERHREEVHLEKLNEKLEQLEYKLNPPEYKDIEK